MGRTTALHQQHLALGARMVDFGGWDMPLHYGSQKAEHLQVRAAAGAFDVSHMTVVDVRGNDARDYLRHLLANDVNRLSEEGRALYTPMLNGNGGVVDDLIVYGLGRPGSSGEWFRLVVNCATRDKDLRWMADQSIHYEVALSERPELAMVAVQGPQARARVSELVSSAKARVIEKLRLFQGLPVEGWFLSRTGYTGEDGLEILLPEAEAPAFWDALMAAGVTACGLGARDTLRLEAGLNLYGAEMDEETSPLEANLGWTLAWEPADRRFVGRDAVAALYQAGAPRRLVGLVLDGRGIMRGGQRLRTPEGCAGLITSGGFSPCLERSIALARVPASIGDHAEVEIRGRWLPVQVRRPLFVRHGQPV